MVLVKKPAQDLVLEIVLGHHQALLVHLVHQLAHVLNAQVDVMLDVVLPAQQIVLVDVRLRVGVIVITPVYRIVQISVELVVKHVKGHAKKLVLVIVSNFVRVSASRIVQIHVGVK